FVFSSRRRHTRFSRDWSSDVCSSDLTGPLRRPRRIALMHDDLAKRRAQMPEGTNRILSARSLASDHRRLYQLLEPGQAVLDAGCGNGAITAGILERVIPGGRVVGVDVNPRLIDEANRRYGGDPRLTFRAGDIYDLEFRSEFDIVTCARVLQWLSRPRAALDSLIRAAVSGGRVLVLDYNHEK